MAQMTHIFETFIGDKAIVAVVEEDNFGEMTYEFQQPDTYIPYGGFVHKALLHNDRFMRNLHYDMDRARY